MPFGVDPLRSVPQPSTTVPPATALDGSKGTASEYARADHTHAARIQRIIMTTAADGTVTWTYARPFVCSIGQAPPITYMVEDTGSPVVCQVVNRTFVTDAGAGTDTHMAVTIKAQRSRVLPAALVTLANLISFDVFGLMAGGVKVNLFAATPTQ